MSYRHTEVFTLNWSTATMTTDFDSGRLLVKQELQKYDVQISHTGQIINSTKNTQSQYLWQVVGKYSR